MSGPPTLGSRLYAAMRVLYPIVLAYLLFATDLAATLGLPLEWLGWIYFGLVVAFFAVPGMVQYPVTTVGKARSVDKHQLRNPGDRECTVCGSKIATGEHREYREQWVLFGVPIKTTDWGENDYCEVCKQREKRAAAPDGPVTASEVRGSSTESGAVGSPSREKETELE